MNAPRYVVFTKEIYENFVRTTKTTLFFAYCRRFHYSGNFDPTVTPRPNIPFQIKKFSWWQNGPS